jgi:hypothetical protein
VSPLETAFTSTEDGPIRTVLECWGTDRFEKVRPSLFVRDDKVTAAEFRDRRALRLES